MQRWWQEPMIPFVVAGAAAFALHASVATPEAESDAAATIVVGAEVRDGLALAFEASTGRAPDTAELDAALQTWIDEEVLYRTALAMGLDRDDTIVRRRLMQKMQFILEERAAVAPPTDDEVSAYIEAHADRFRSGLRYTATHVFIDPARVAEPAAAAAEALAAVRAGAPPETLGSPFPRGGRVVAQPIERFVAILGARFADAVAAAEVGTWFGPVESPFGLHVVRVDSAETSTSDARLVRERAAQALQSERAAAATGAALAELRARYQIVEVAP